MRELLSENYFPFGSQYYRAPSPARSEWDRDLSEMARLGFNTVKFWVQWRWNNPAEGEYYFDDIDELMDLAAKYKLKVMLNTIFDVAPAWIYKKYPDASMITLAGKVIGPQAQPHRQIGGLGYCFNNDPVVSHQMEFLKATVERYKDHPALEIWNVGSEPELTSSMAEMRRPADNVDLMDDLLCYCDNCRTKFAGWLENKYGDIEKLNVSWNRNYRSFDEAEVPKTRNTFNDMIDWRMFFVDTLGKNVKRRFETAEAVDKGNHPLMCHHVFIQGFPLTSTANDPWNVGQYGDLHGFTQMDDVNMIDILRSCAKNKPVISAEMLMLPGYTLELPKEIDSNDVKRLIFSGIAGNLKGFIFWQYRPELLGREAPTWGLSTLDGKSTPWLEAYAEAGNVLTKNADFLLDAQPEKAEVAMLFNPENQVFIWEATGNEKNSINSILGFHKALYERNFIIDFLHPMEFDNKNILDQYKVVVLPCSYVVDPGVAEALEKWVAEGGVLIGEAYTAGWDIKAGRHSDVVPGYGLDKVFKARQWNAVPATEEGYEPIRLVKDLPGHESFKNIYGYKIKEILSPEGAEILAEFSDGSPAVTYAEYGKGKAILIGSYMGLSYFTRSDISTGQFLTSLVDNTVKIERPATEKNIRIRTDILTKGEEKMVIIRNLEEFPVNTGIVTSLPAGTELEEQFTGEKVITEENPSGSVIRTSLTVKEVKVFRV